MDDAISQLRKRREAARAYNRAKRTYDDFVAKLDVQLVGPTPEQQKRAATDPGLKEAEGAYLEALRLSVEMDHTGNVAAVRFQLGLLTQLEGRFDESIEWFTGALETKTVMVRERSDFTSHISQCHFYLGKAYLRTGDPVRARDHFIRAAAIDETIGLSRDRRRATTELLRECGAPPPDDDLTDDGSDWLDDAFDPEVSDEELIASLTTAVPPAMLWVVTSTAAARDKSLATVAGILGGASGLLQVIGTALEGQDLDVRPDGALRVDPRLTAVLLVIEQAALAEPAFLKFVDWALREFSRRDDFRIFIHFHDLTSADVNLAAAADDRNAPLLTVIESVQWATVETPDHVRRSLRAYLTFLKDTRRSNSWFRLRAVSSMTIGRAAAVMELAAVAAAVVFVVWLPVWSPSASHLRWLAGNEIWIGVFCGAAWFPLMTMALHTLTRFGPTELVLPVDAENPIWARFLVLLILPVVLAARQVNAPPESIMLGQAIGFLLDAGRRIGARNRRERRRIELDSIARKHAVFTPATRDDRVTKLLNLLLPRLPEFIARKLILLRFNNRPSLADTWLNPLRCPLFPIRTPRVFISYPRRSIWARKRARELATHLADVGIKAFLDRHDIQSGSSWRHALDRHLGRSTVFVCLVDSVAVGRGWPAAEMEAALGGLHLCALPHIIILKAPGLPYASKQTFNWLPVFRRTVVERFRRAGDGAPVVIEDSPSATEAIAYAVHPQTFRSASVLPLWLALWTDVVASLGIIWLLGLQSVAPLAGFLAIPVLVFDWLGRIDVTQRLVSAGCFQVAFWAAAYWMGGVARMTLLSRYELRTKDASTGYEFRMFATASLAALLVYWSTAASVLVVGWAIVSMVLGYFVIEEFAGREIRRRSGWLAAAE